ncbi:MAG: hypothetical protein WAQ42_02390, partial [Limnochordia bacterium]
MPRGEEHPTFGQLLIDNLDILLDGYIVVHKLTSVCFLQDFANQIRFPFLSANKSKERQGMQ